jgi:hypothetical protein
MFSPVVNSSSETILQSFVSTQKDTQIIFDSVDAKIYSESREAGRIILVANQNISSMPLPEFKMWYFQKALKPVATLANTVISNLLKERDYLGLQLDLAFENISEDDFLAQEKTYYLQKLDNKLEDLKGKIKMLFGLSNRAYDAEELSVMFNCDVSEAEQAIEALLIA